MLRRNSKRCCSCIKCLRHLHTFTKDDVEYVSNKYKYKGTIEDFYSYCEINKYKISYSISDSINNDCSCITFSIVKAKFQSFSFLPSVDFFLLAENFLHFVDIKKIILHRYFFG